MQTPHRATFIPSVILAVLALSAPSSIHAADPALEAYLRQCDRDYSDELAMLGATFSSPGYHTTVPGGTWYISPTKSRNSRPVSLSYRNGWSGT